MRTLVISDLHLGMRYRRDVLRGRRPLAVLLDALADVQRLVLLGDVVELSEHDSSDALAVAGPVLRALGERLGPDGEGGKPANVATDERCDRSPSGCRHGRADDLCGELGGRPSAREFARRGSV
jgi:hypothetical protein